MGVDSDVGVDVGTGVSGLGVTVLFDLSGVAVGVGVIEGVDGTGVFVNIRVFVGVSVGVGSPMICTCPSVSDGVIAPPFKLVLDLPSGVKFVVGCL